MTDDTKFDSYLRKLIDLSERKMEIARESAAVYRAARRDKVSVEDLKQEMKDRFHGLVERSAEISKATIEREHATIPPKIPRL
jgi:hypothetical protein